MPVDDKRGEAREPGRISAGGLSEAVLATLASSALAGLIAFMHARGLAYWLAGIGVLYAFSLAQALRIHALSYRDGSFRAEPLLGKPVEFRGRDIRDIAYDDRSRPPRARIELKDGRRILIKKPLWMRPAPPAEFEERIRENPG